MATCRTIGTIVLAALVVWGCGGEEKDKTIDPDQIFEPGKEDSLNDRIGDCSVVHQTGKDITVLEAHLVGRFVPSTVTVPGDFNVDCSRCQVLESEPSNSYDCQFYDICETQTLDCTAELESLTGLDFITEAVFYNVFHTVVTYDDDAPTNDAGQTVEKWYSEGFNCWVLQITTASRSAALEHADGIGFYYDGDFGYMPRNQLFPSGFATFKNGDEATLHEFGEVAVCWSGSMSSSMNAVYQFKPFMKFVSGDTCYLKWDYVPENYRISSSIESFDRSAEILR
jgi:hypothetical protein